LPPALSAWFGSPASFAAFLLVAHLTKLSFKKLASAKSSFSGRREPGSVGLD
jgi:hypothetical protein